MVRQAPRAEQHQPPGADGRSGRGLRPLRLGEVDPHPDDQRARADQRGETHRRRNGPLGQEDQPQQAAGGDRLRLPAVQPLPPPVGPEKHHPRSDQDPEHPREGGRRTGDGASGARRIAREAGRLPGRALRRAAAAGGDRPGAGDETEDHALRRAHLGPRPRDDRRGPPGHEGSGDLRDDDDRGHARNGIRPGGLPPRRLHGPRDDPGGGPAGGVLQKSTARKGEAVPEADPFAHALIQHQQKEEKMARKIGLFVAALAMVGALCGAALAADTLADVKKKGVLVAGVKDSLPPFGSVDPQTKEFVGYDIDFVKYIAKKLGVRVEFKPVTSANRMPMLMEGRVDILAATMTKNPERAKQVDFSYTYFLTGQKFLTKKGTVRKLADLNGKKIGTSKGSTSEQNAAKAVPSAIVLSLDDYPQGILALQQGKVVAVTTDESILAGQLGMLQRKTATKGKYEIPDLQISMEPYGIGMRKGDTNFVKFVNDTLLEMEKNGEAKKIFLRWFGPNSESPINRGSFMITADRMGLE